MVASVIKRVLLSSLLLVVFISLASADDKNKESKDSKPHPAPKVSRRVQENHTNNQGSRQNTNSAQGQGLNNPNGYSNRTQDNQNANQTNTYHPASNVDHPPTNADSNRGSVNAYHPDVNTYSRNPQGNSASGNSGRDTNDYKGNFNRSSGAGTSAGSGRTDFTRSNNLNARDVHDRDRNDFHAPNAHPANQAHVVREAPRTIRQFHDKQVAFDHGGNIREVHARDMDIHRGLRGDRRFVTEVHGRTIVSVGRNRGYVQQSYISRSGRVYVQART